MDQRLQELFDDLDRHRADLRAAVDAVPPGLRQRRPAPDRWSVAEVLEHLALVESRLTQMLAAKVAAAQAAGVVTAGAGPAAASRFDAARMLDRRSRFKNGAASEPTGRLDADEAWTRLEQSRRGLFDLAGALSRAPLQDIRHPHPAFGPLNVYEWVAFLGGHDARHADQIREAGRALA